MSEIWTVIIAALVGGVVSYAGAMVKNALEVRRGIDDRLREKRNFSMKLYGSKPAYSREGRVLILFPMPGSQNLP